MKKLLWNAAAVLLLLSGSILIVRGVAPFVRDFGALETGQGDLLPRILSLLAGLFCLAGARIAFQMSRANR